MRCLSLFLTLLSALLFSRGASACHCAFLRTLKDTSQLQQHTFIARVLITDDGGGFLSMDAPDTGPIHFKVLELFKGQAVEQLIETSRNSSCDLGILKGQEWVLFARRENGELQIGPCDWNVMYRNQRGEKDWLYQRGFDVLDKLRELFQRPAPVADSISFYKSGKKEQEAQYKNGLLQGERKTWYADGKLCGIERFSNGLPEGRSEWYYPSGQLFREEYYHAGKNRNVTRTYYDTAINPAMKRMLIATFYKTEDSLNMHRKRIQVHYEKVYNADGSLVLTRSYFDTGQIEQEWIHGRPDEHGISILYYRDGRIRYLSNTHKGVETGLYQEFDEDGEHARTGIKSADGSFKWIDP